MSDPNETTNASQSDVELARERTRQAGIMGWTAGIIGIGAAVALADHPTWPCAAGVAAVAAMVAFVCRAILKVHFEAMWRVRSAILRKIIRGALIVMMLAGWVVFFSFNMHGESNAQHERMVLNVGAFDPWCHWESVTEKSATSSSHHSSSGFHVFTWSFAAVIMAVLCQAALKCIRRWEKSSQDVKA